VEQWQGRTQRRLLFVFFSIRSGFGEPPHLAAINPWEGWSDFYREVARHGGIPETEFWDICQAAGDSVRLALRTCVEKPRSIRFRFVLGIQEPDLSKITVPAYVMASWTDQGYTHAEP